MKACIGAVGSCLEVYQGYATCGHWEVLSCAGVVEEGRIYFFYKPRVGVEEAHNIDEVQRVYMILAPTSRPKVKARWARAGLP